MKYILITIVFACIGACGVCNVEEDASVKGDSTFVKDSIKVDTAVYEVRP